MRKIIFLLSILLLFSCRKEEKHPDPIDLRNTSGEITMDLHLDNLRWGGGDDLTIILTLTNDPKDTPELQKYMLNVGGQESPTELSVDWGDGTVNSETTHTYAEYGYYRVVIKGRGINWFSDEKIHRRSIEVLNLRKCPTLQGIISKSESRRPADGDYSFRYFPYLEYIDFNHIIGIEKIDLSRNKYLKGLVTYNIATDYGVDFSTLPQLEFVTSTFSLNKKTFESILKKTNLRYLSVEVNSEEIDFSRLEQLEELVLLMCNIKTIDLSKNINLKRLVLNHRHIHSIEVCPYNDEVMNAIYSKLPSTSGELITNIPFGDKSIAEKKGWKVVQE